MSLSEFYLFETLKNDSTLYCTNKNNVELNLT
jgi:hypothetical protein